MLELLTRTVSSSRTRASEFSVAKRGYVKTKNGWISDRTACYLASGKPTLVQSTGFESQPPVGKGLLTFATIEEAVEGISAINDDYLTHCRAARQIAEEHFNSDLVLGSILERVGPPWSPADVLMGSIDHSFV